MNSTTWLQHFQTNKLNRPEPDWNLPGNEDPATAAPLARSLSHFQLGESGDGGFLLAEGRRRHPHDPEYVKALELFVGEEQEHARLLTHLVARFGGKLIRRHWTHTCFCLIRRALGVNFEIQTLVIAELIGTAYYRLLHRHARDRVLRTVCGLMLGDEARHIEFHGDRFADWQSHWLPLRRGPWVLQFQCFLVVTARAAWLDHRRALRGLGATRREFLREVNGECASFLHALSRPGIPAGSAESLPPESKEMNMGYERSGLPTG